MAVFDTLRPLIRLHYATNLLLAALFFILKITPVLCDALFHDCKLELREWEWLTFLGCIIVLKNRRQVNLASYLTTACMFGKALSFILFFKQSIALGVVYICLCLLHFVFLPQPTYDGPEKIVYFRGPNLQEELERDKRITWVISFYAAWSPQCLTFAPIFAELSAEYTLDNLKFGKIDVSRYPQVAEQFAINTSTWSKQLPTVILFQDGKEKIRRPVSTKKTTLKFLFTKENVVRDLELNEIYGQCKKNPLPSRRKDKEATDAKKEQ